MAKDGEVHAGTVTLGAATSVVVGNMVGMGVFTSLGFQVLGIQSGFVLMLLWALGGVFALCGALCYGELAAALPRSGGEYHFLSRIYHPLAGFLAGWISITVGFAAPVALAAMAFGKYFGEIVPVAGMSVAAVQILAGVVLVVGVTAIHLIHIGVGSRFQTIFTALKVGLILVLIGAAFVGRESQGVSFLPGEGDLGQLWSEPFAVSLVFVMYAYTGWNAATYIVNEVKEPRRVVPRALLVGTGLVMALYLGLNAAFLHSTPMGEMAGKEEVGLVAAQHIFGTKGGNLMGALICLGLVSTVSAMTWAGPRVAQMIGEDYRMLRVLAVKSGAGVPVVAVLSQGAIVLVLLFTASFEEVLLFVQFLLLLSAALTVGGVFWLRIREPELERPLKAWGYPVTPALYIGVSVWMMLWVARAHPVQTRWGGAVLMAGVLLYLVARAKERAGART